MAVECLLLGWKADWQVMTNVTSIAAAHLTNIVLRGHGWRQPQLNSSQSPASNRLGFALGASAGHCRARQHKRPDLGGCGAAALG